MGCNSCSTTSNTQIETDSCAIDDAFVSLRLRLYCKTTKYAESDGCRLLGLDGIDAETIVWSKTVEPNGDRPIDGVRKTPPTWGMITLCELAKKVEAL